MNQQLCIYLYILPLLSTQSVNICILESIDLQLFTLYVAFQCVILIFGFEPLHCTMIVFLIIIVSFERRLFVKLNG